MAGRKIGAALNEPNLFDFLAGVGQSLRQLVMASPMHLFFNRLLCGGVWLAFFLTAPTGFSQAETNEMRSVAAIRALSVGQLEEKIPVHLRGTVTFLDENLFSRFLQDGTAGIYLKFPNNVAPPPLKSGQVVEVTGYASAGEYAPVVVAGTVTVTGEAPLPEAKAVDYEELASGAEDSQFVEVHGIVRSVRRSETEPYFEIEIATGGGRLLVFAKDLPVSRADDLVDTGVRVRGVCSTKFNHKRQLFAIRLMVPRGDDLAIETAAPQNPFAIPIRQAGSLLQFSTREKFGHRVKIAGVVTYFDHGRTIYVQDSEHGVEVQTRQAGSLALGDNIEVLGFVSQGDYTPFLQDAVFQKIAASTQSSPVNVNADGALTGNFDCELVRTSARLIDRTRTGAEEFLLLQDGNVIFQASLKTTNTFDSFASVANGSLIALTGICRIDPGEWTAGPGWRAKAFNILLRSPSDVVVVTPPPWWTLRRLLWSVGVLVLVALAAFGWVAILQRKVSERTRELSEQIQHREIAERRREIEQERARVAHDLHDDLGAGLTEVNMLTSLVKSPATSADEKDRYLGDLSKTALRMVTSLDEIVWAVNPRNDTIASLASYFGSYAQRLLDLASISCGLDIAEDLPERPLDPKFRQEVFFAFKEALNNVVRHARATQVWLRISVQEEKLIVEVADDGHGMEAAASAAGGDGIANMNGRLQAIGGECEIKSDMQKGTTVTFRAPLPQENL
jgi:signal transduction histidine kinase